MHYNNPLWSHFQPHNRAKSMQLERGSMPRMNNLQELFYYILHIVSSRAVRRHHKLWLTLLIVADVVHLV